MMDFSGKTALVTGGTRGIGKAICDTLASLGCTVIYTGAKECAVRQEAGKIFIHLDYLKKDTVSRFLKKIGTFPRIDILVNNAGINIIDDISKIKDADWTRVIDVNLSGAMTTTRAVSRKMMKARTGHILNISSIFGIISKEKRSAYSASKAGLIGLTRSCALDLAPYGILVNALCPGFTRTDLTESILRPKEIVELASSVPLGRFADVSEIAIAAVFLCSDMNSYMTGQAVMVDGGYTCK